MKLNRYLTPTGILVVATILIIGVGLLFIPRTSHKHVSIEPVSPVVTLGEGWEYRWCDSPRDAAGVPLWTYEELDNPAWQPLSTLGWPPNPPSQATFWLRTTLPPEEHWPEPALFIPLTGQLFELYLDQELLYQFGELDD